MLSRNWKKIMWAAIAVIALFFIGILYSMFFRPVVAGSNNNVVAMLIIGLALGALLMFLLFRANKAARTTGKIVESSHTVVESMRKVFKIVCAEGYFSEIYDYKESKKYFSFIPAYKRALVIVKAKTLIGFDFEKFEWETDEENHKLKLVSFPEPQLLSIETDYNYYSIEDELFYKFSNEDFKNIQSNAKKQVEQAAMQSDLPKIASEQMRTMLTEMIQSKQWQLEGVEKLPGLLPVAIISNEE
jgi:hypothetical protein